MILSRKCQFCAKPFNLKGRHFDSLWDRCECGKSFLDGDIIYNEDEFELKIARLRLDIFIYGFHINSSAAYEAILHRLIRDGADALPVPRRVGALYESRLPPQKRHLVNFDFDRFVRYGRGQLASRNFFAIDIVAVLFSDFYEFTACLGDVSTGTRAVESTWGTYVSGSPYIENPVYIVTG
ncbi:hypothetical protein D9M68_775760 [compost metagenome]